MKKAMIISAMLCGILMLPTAACAQGDGYKPAVGFNWHPGASNQPVGDAKGINPGRVVMARDGSVTKWSGHWRQNSDQWWLDKNTDTDGVEHLLSFTIQKLTGEKNDKKAWKEIFKYYNKTHRGISRGYKPGEVVLVKINLNNSGANKQDNLIDASPQMVLAMVRQLVNEAGVRQQDVMIYDIRRQIYPMMLTEIWKEFPDVQFLQDGEARSSQPKNPKYGTHQGIQAAKWVKCIDYSYGNFNDARVTAQQVVDATYLVNLALLKLHSYPYNYMEDGDEGQTAITMSSKNHAGSIRGTGELHHFLNTKQDGKPHAYNPLVDLEASPKIGAKTILYVLDGLYCGRKWRSYPLHFPNYPFNNKVEPYENAEWPAAVLVSQDGVALQSVGLDIMYAQSQNNRERHYHNVPRILLRDNASDILEEEATPYAAPSGIVYKQDGKPVGSLGVFEHWNNDQDMKYSRNLDPVNGKGIEFLWYDLTDK